MRPAAICALLFAIALATAGAASGGPASAQAQPPRVLVYGDSLSWEARFELERAIEAQLPGWDAIVNTIPGVATCDLLPAMRADANLNAGVVVLEFVGVPLTPCMQNRDAVTADQDDLDTAIGIWAARGVPVVNVAAPRRVDLPRDLDTVGAIYRDTAARTGQQFVDAGVLLRNPWTGIYQHRLPCLEGEGPDQGCGPDGTIPTRDVTTGTHFCPITNDATVCPIYSSGIVRYSAAIAAEAARAAGGTPTALPSVPDASGIRDIATALFAGTGSTTSAPGSTSPTTASAAVLTADLVPPDIPARADAPTAPAPALTSPSCRSFRKAVATLDGAARADVAFAAVDDSASVAQMVRVLPTARRARNTFRAYSGAKAEACLGAAFGAPVSVEQAIGIGDDAVTYRAAGARNLVVDVVRSDRAITALTYTNAASPPPAAFVDAITHAAVDRLDTALGAAPGG